MITSKLRNETISQALKEGYSGTDADGILEIAHRIELDWNSASKKARNARPNFSMEQKRFHREIGRSFAEGMISLGKEEGIFETPYANAVNSVRKRFVSHGIAVNIRHIGGNKYAV